MGIASYHRVYRRALPTGEAGCRRNPACRLTAAPRACVLQKSRTTIEQGPPEQQSTPSSDRRRGDKSFSFTEVH
jgi:hypothetical protein